MENEKNEKKEEWDVACIFDSTPACCVNIALSPHE